RSLPVRLKDALPIRASICRSSRIANALSRAKLVLRTAPGPARCRARQLFPAYWRGALTPRSSPGGPRGGGLLIGVPFGTKIFWHLQANWHWRHQPVPYEVSVQETVKGLQALLLAEQGAVLQQTLQLVYARPVPLEALNRLKIALYQEGIDQRVWRAQATL